MSDEVEKVKEGDPDFMLHQHKPVGRRETDEAEEGEDFELHQHKPVGRRETDEAEEGDDFELHQHKPVGDIVEKHKEV